MNVYSHKLLQETDVIINVKESASYCPLSVSLDSIEYNVIVFGAILYHLVYIWVYTYSHTILKHGNVKYISDKTTQNPLNYICRLITIVPV